MYKIASLGLLGLLVVLVMPVSEESTITSPFYGGATMVLYDEDGQEKFSQTVHNRLFDVGEDFILTQVFTDIAGTDATTDATQVGAICIAAGTPSTDEADTLSQINAQDTSSGGAAASRCITDQNGVTNATQIATIDATFITGTNWDADDTISHITICAAASDTNPVTDCVAPFFALVDTSNVTPTGTETVTITYTFDISNNSS